MNVQRQPTQSGQWYKMVGRMAAIMLSLGVTLIVVHLACAAQATKTSSTTAPGDDSGYLSYALQLEHRDGQALSDMKLPNIMSVAFRFLVSLLIIVGIIMAAALAYKKFFGMTSSTLREAQVIKVLAHRFLDPKKSIYVVEIAQRLLVLGSSGEQLTVLCEITEPAEKQIVYTALESRAESMRGRDFKKILAGFAGNSSTQEERVEPSRGTASDAASLRMQLDNIKRMLHEKK